MINSITKLIPNINIFYNFFTFRVILKFYKFILQLLKSSTSQFREESDYNLIDRVE